MRNDTGTTFDPGVTEEEMRQLDVDLEGVWFGVTGAIWSRPAGRVERVAATLLRSPALARTLVTTPSLILSWLVASLAVFAIGAFAASATELPIVPLLAPAVAGVAVAFAYGAGADPAYEIARTMPTSARMILLLRVGAVFATNALLGTIASFFTPSLADLTLLWLLPMVAISLLGLAVAVVTRSATVGGVVALAVWGTIVLGNEMRYDDVAEAVSGASLERLAPMYLLLAAISLGITLWISGDGSKRRELAGWL